MNRCKYLPKLHRALVARLYGLERRLAACSHLPAHDRDPVISYVVIESLNAWAQFSKAFYLSCILNARTGAKLKVAVTPAGVSMNDAIGRAILLYKRYATPNTAGEWSRRDEPAWHDPNVLLRACQNMGCSIQGQVQAAFSMGQHVFLDLPVFRNFYGHRNRMSCRAAQNLGPKYLLPSSERPSELLTRRRAAVGTSLLEEWLSELRITAELLCS
jgi:hypothetical protein